MPNILALDLETTGLDPLEHQIIEIGAAIDAYPHQYQDVSKVPTFRRAIFHRQIVGEPVAIAMNTKLIRRIADGEGDPLARAIYDLRDWAGQYLPKNDRGYLDNAVVAGKNVWKLDLRMLLHAKDEYSAYSNAESAGASFVKNDLHHRVLDPTTLYHDPFNDRVPPSMRECLKRAGLENEPWALEDHDPVNDCLKVLALLRHKWRT